MRIWKDARKTPKSRIFWKLQKGKSSEKLVFRTPGFSLHFARAHRARVVLHDARDETVAGRTRCPSMKDSPAGCFLIQELLSNVPIFNR
jgi:hypothetical protein